MMIIIIVIVIKINTKDNVYSAVVIVYLMNTEQR